MTEILSFRDLDVWKVAMDLVVTTYEVSGRFPRTEQFALTSQMQRAAVSVPSNVAEGHATGPGRRYRNHIRIALGSLAELATQMDGLYQRDEKREQEYLSIREQIRRLTGKTASASSC